MGRNTGPAHSITNAEISARYQDIISNHTLKQLHLLMQNWADGSAEKVIMYNVLNCFDAWRKLCHDQHPAVEHQKQMLWNKFHHLNKASSLKEMRERIQDMERIAAMWSQVADAPFGEDSKLTEPKAIVRNDIYKSVALAARRVTRYGGFVHLLEAQTKDPITGGDVWRQSSRPE